MPLSTTTNINIDPYHYGRLTAEVAQLQHEVTELRTDMKKVLETLQEARGGWRLLMLVAGVAATVGGAVVKFLPFVAWK